MKVDVVIIGGGVAGLWILDNLRRRGQSALLFEAAALGHGQTVASQGIIHGGLKYTLGGMLTRSAAAIRQMPLIWHECLAGRRMPDLSGTRLRSNCCYLWRTDAARSRLGMIGARFGLRIAPEVIAPESRPPILARCPGTVARLDEPVICPVSLLAKLSAPHRDVILRVNPTSGTRFETNGSGGVMSILLRNPGDGQAASLEPRWVVFAAGAGNAALRRQAGLPGEVMQRRPLNMVMVRGELPILNGHCVDGARTRVTITSAIDAVGRTVWQLGGQIAEEGITMTSRQLVEFAQRELEAVLPGIDLTDAEWASYAIDRAEGKTPGNGRPDDVQIVREGNVLTVWPTKLALAPRLAEQVAAKLTGEPAESRFDSTAFANWPKPDVASPPWETSKEWIRLPMLTAQAARAA